MARFDRYLLSQLLVLFGFFSLILVLIYWINRAVRLFDQLIADGQNIWVFLELTSLSLPSIIRVVLPLSAFVSAVYVTNRMASDSELTVVQATGYSPFRLARPVVYFGVIVAVLMSVLVHALVPWSTERLSLRQSEIAENITARLLTPGEFLSPSDGTTFYIRDVSIQGEMLDIFISDTTNPDLSITYTATKAYLIRSDNGPQLVMIDGLAQTLDKTNNRLLTTGFDDFAYDVGNLIDTGISTRRPASGLPTWDLIGASDKLLEATQSTQTDLWLRAHDRFAQVALSFVAALVGFAALVAGGFSRFGLWRYIMLAIFLVVVLKVLESTGSSIARKDPDVMWPFMYLAGVGGIIISAALLFISARPYFFKRKPKINVPLQEANA